MSTKDEKGKPDPKKTNWSKVAAETFQKANILKGESLRLEGEYRLLKKLIEEGVL